jgi:hypothetical protein
MAKTVNRHAIRKQCYGHGDGATRGPLTASAYRRARATILREQSSTYDTWRLSSSTIRLASATISSAGLFSKFEGLSGKGRFEPGEKIDALQPLPTRLISIRYPLYSIGVTLKGCCAGIVWPGTRRRRRCSGGWHYCINGRAPGSSWWWYPSSQDHDAQGNPHVS